MVHRFMIGFALALCAFQVISYQPLPVGSESHEVLRMGQGTLENAIWHPSENSFLVNSSQGVWVYSTAFERMAHLPDLHTGTFAPDGMSVAGTDTSGKVILWDIKNGRQIGVFSSISAVNQVTFSLDGKFLAGSGGRSLTIWNVNTRKVEYTFSVPYEIYSMSWKPTSDKIALAGRNSIQILDVLNNNIEALNMNAGGEAIYKLAWSHTDNLLAVAAIEGSSIEDNSLQIWNVSTKQMRQVIQAGHIDDIDWHPKQPLLATANRQSSNNTAPSVKVWNPITGKLMGELNRYTHDVLSVKWSPDGTKLLTVSADNTAKIADWPSQSTSNQSILKGFGSAVTSLAWNGMGTIIASGHEDGSIREWNTQTGKPLSVLLGNERQVWSVAWSPTGKALVSGGGDYSVRSWDVSTDTMSLLYKHDQTIFDNIPGVFTVDWGAKGDIASGGSDGTVRIFSGGKVIILQQTRGTIFAVHWNPKQPQLVVADGNIHVWKMNPSPSSKMLACNVEGIWTGAAFSPDGKQIAGTTNTGNLCIWDTQTFQAFIPNTGLIAPLAWSPNGSQIAGISKEDPTQVQIVDAASEQSIGIIAIGDVVRSLAWKPDGTQLATGTQSGIIQIWQ
jgi:WD40 repeat protein